jgi:autophagy-related protein 17
VDEHERDEARPEARGSPLFVNRSLSSTLRNGLVGRKPTARERERRSRQADRALWKTLRDFVDEQAIEDVLETIENDRLGLDVSGESGIMI